MDIHLFQFRIFAAQRCKKCCTKQSTLGPETQRQDAACVCVCVWWWIETSDGHNRGRTLNWLTDPSLRQRKGWPNRRGRLSISPPPPPAPKHTGDLLHSNDPRWVKSGVMKRRGCAKYRGVPHFRGSWMDDRVKMATPADLSPYWVATRGYVIISIRPFLLYAVTISLASNVWNEMCVSSVYACVHIIQRNVFTGMSYIWCTFFLNIQSLISIFWI